MNYRGDIDGLRAISILAVVAFHVGMPFVYSGYIGVDIFFVISGYLITKLLLEEKARTGKIDLMSFWARRVRRLLPSLLFVIATTLLAGTFFLERVSGEVGNLAKAAIAALLINANHYFLMVTGDYFGAKAEMNPLLHFWTLSVEEQFYVIWPLLLLLVANRQEALSKVLIVSIGIASFIGCILLTASDRSLAFFAMPTRAWEFMAGAALAVLHIRGLRENKIQGLILAIIGTSLLIYSIFFLGDSSAFPGALAFFPVAGAAITILAGTVWPNNPIAKVLQIPSLTYIGRISYVWYLWHWPILVFARSADLYEKNLSHNLLAAALSFFLAAFTHHYIEAPSRKYGMGVAHWNSKRILILGLSSTAVICAFSVLVGAWARFGWFYSENERYLNAARHDLPSLSCLFTEGNNEQDYEECLSTKARQNGAVLLWGDSHANHWSPALIGATQSQEASLVILTRRACMPIVGDIQDKGCMHFNDYVLSQLGEMHRNGLRGVVLSARWPEYVGAKPLSIGDAGGEALFFNEEDRADAITVFEARLQALVHEMDKLNLRILIILPSPILRHAAVQCLARKSAGECGISQITFNKYAIDSITAIKHVASKHKNVKLIDPQAIMCKQGFCSVIQNGVVAYTDDDHLTASFVRALSSHVDKEISWLLSPTSK